MAILTTMQHSKKTRRKRTSSCQTRWQERLNISKGALTWYKFDFYSGTIQELIKTVFRGGGEWESRWTRICTGNWLIPTRDFETVSCKETHSYKRELWWTSINDILVSCKHPLTLACPMVSTLRIQKGKGLHHNWKGVSNSQNNKWQVGI